MDLGTWYVGPFEKALENLLEQLIILHQHCKGEDPLDDG